MRRLPLLPLVLAGSLAGCAAIFGGGGGDGEARLRLGLAELERGNYARAFEPLVWLVTNEADSDEGRRAMLVLAASDLDPRNPQRRLGVGSELAARYIRESETEAWTRPVAETLFLLAQELGAAEERVAEAEAEVQRAEARARRTDTRSVPTYSGQTVPKRIQAISEERDRLARRVNSLEQELRAKEQELERIRKTLRP